MTAVNLLLVGSHVVNSVHTRSEVMVGAADSNARAPHAPILAQKRSVVAVAGVLMNCTSASHCVCGVHTASDVAV